MEDIIDIIVTETTNLIEITSQPTDEIIDVNIIDNREDVTLNVTPTVVEININSLTGNFGVNWGDIEGTLSNQTDLQTVLNAKADLVDGKVPSSQLPSYVDDVVEVANYAALPVTGEVGKIYITLDTNFIYRWSGSTYIEIKDSSAVWGAITGTLSSQTDLQSALDAKVTYTGATGNVNLGEYGATVGYLGFDTTPTSTPTGIGTTYWDSFYRTLSLIDGDGDTTLQIGQEERVLVHNNTGSTLTDGQVVYVIGSTGELPSVALASNTSETTSSVTFGIVTESIAHGANGFITTSGIIHGLNTNAYDEGAAIYLGSTAGTFTQTKPVAPANSVLVGYIIKKSGGNGSIFVKIQNGYELEELHDVLITSKANNDGLFYESSTSLWKNKSIATVLGYTPANDASVVKLTGSQSIAGDKRFLDNAIFDFGIGLRTPAGLYQYFEALNGGGYRLGVVTAEHDFYFSTANNYSYTFPAASGTIALTSNLSAYLPLGGGTMTGVLFGASASFSGFVGFGGNTSPLAAIDVTGAGIFSSSVTATRLILSGGTSPTGLYFGHTDKVVLANYTVGGGIDFETNGGNITMQLSSGGVLSTTGGASFSGALSGTSATFTSSITAETFLRASAGAQTNPTGGASVAIDYQTTSDGQGRIRSRDWDAAAWRNLTIEANNIVLTPAGKVAIGTTAPEGLLTIQGTSAQPPTSGTTANSLLQLVGSLGGQLNIGSNTVAGEYGSYIQVSDNNLAVSYPLLLQPNGGQVGIGTYNLSSVGSALVVAQSGTPNISTIRRLDASNTGAGRLFFQATNSSGSVQNVGFIESGLESSSTNGYLMFASNTTERMRITSSGSVLVGTTSATGLNTAIAVGSSSNAGFILQISGTNRGYFYASGNAVFLESTNSATIYVAPNGANGVYIAPGSTSWTSNSDIRLKNVNSEITNALEKINTLKAINYSWKSDTTNKENIGLIAQEVNEVLPQIIDTNKDGYLGVRYTELVPVLVQAIKELKAELDTLKNK